MPQPRCCRRYVSIVWCVYACDVCVCVCVYVPLVSIWVPATLTYADVCSNECWHDRTISFFPGTWVHYFNGGASVVTHELGHTVGMGHATFHDRAERMANARSGEYVTNFSPSTSLFLLVNSTSDTDGVHRPPHHPSGGRRAASVLSRFGSKLPHLCRRSHIPMTHHFPKGTRIGVQ